MGKSADSSSEEEEGTMADHSLDSQLPLLVLPLYSLLSTKLQTKVHVVIATTTTLLLSYKTVSNLHFTNTGVPASSGRGTYVRSGHQHC